MPQFLEVRYDTRVRTLLAVFWLLVYVFVNLTSVLYLGALALERIMGVSLWAGVIGLAVFAIMYSVYGGLKAVAWTDVVYTAALHRTHFPVRAVVRADDAYAQGTTALAPVTITTLPSSLPITPSRALRLVRAGVVWHDGEPFARRYVPARSAASECPNSVDDGAERSTA